MTEPTSPEFDSLVPAVGFTRRHFVVTALATGFALAAQPVVAQSMIKTDTQGLVAGDVIVPVADGRLPVYRAQPATDGLHPVVLVVQEIFGVHEHIRDVCRRLAKLGYMAIAPELYARHGDVSKMENVQRIMDEVVPKVEDAQVMSDLDACVEWAARNGGNAEKLGITGFCWGGRIVWLYAAHSPRLKAGVAWYGRLDGPPIPATPRHPLDIADQLRAPVLGLYGGKDQGIPVEDVEAMQKALDKAGGKSVIFLYPDAPHAFHADYRPSYRKEPAEDGWRRMLDWFRKHGV